VLHIHRAERADGLVEALGALLAVPLADPLASEVVAVPTRGMERWLAQSLSAVLGTTPGRHDGVCANVDFPWPRTLVGGVLASASGIDPEDDPWLPERTVWPLLSVVDDNLTEPWLTPLATYLGGTLADSVRRGRRLSTVRHLADLFGNYGLHRPETMRDWASGDTGGYWQAELWRRLRERIGEMSPAERLESACRRVQEEPEIVALPRRLSVFGLTRLPAGDLVVLRALADARDVHLFVLHPSSALWEKLRGCGPVVRREDDPTADVPANRVLASWGQDAREMQLVLAAGGEHRDHHHEIDRHAGSLLGHIQANVGEDRPPAGAPMPGAEDERPRLDPGDLSVQVHSCHGRARQVEVAREAILHLLKDDPTLEPRDVIVMCPDIETFAPLIQATFGVHEPLGGSSDMMPSQVNGRPIDLRVRLADRSLRQTNPILAVVAELLELASERLTASQVLDFVDREPVRRRFRFDDDDLTRIQEWIAESRIHWGLDAEHRDAYKLESLDAGTWRAGLDRLLLGVAMTEDEQRLFAGVLPVDDVESGAIDLAGKLAELIERLGAAIDSLNRSQTIEAWADALATAADALTAASERDQWQRAELARLLEDIVQEASPAVGANATPITLPEVRALLAERLQGRPTRANFRTGHLTICTLVPMRSVPHRVVCLLGLDDGVFPRKTPRDGDDLMLDAPRVGERDSRSEDRQLLLDALMAATDTLVVTYSGNDERTNAVRPPAVPVGELLDMVEATVSVDDGHARDTVLVRHPLQTFDPRNFTSEALVPGRTWSFDAVTLEGARALGGSRADPRPFLAGPLPPAATEIIEVEDLVRFVQHPVRAFLRQRLGITVGDFSTEVEDDLPIELDGLGKWGVGQRLLEARLDGVDGRAAVLAEIARGTLPTAVLGQPVINEVFPVVEGIAAVADSVLADDSDLRSIDVRITLPDGRLLSGTVAGVNGHVLRSVTYSTLGPKHRLAAWVRLLALTAANPDQPFAATTIGRGWKSPAMVAQLEPLGDAAIGQLMSLIDLWDRGLREPLPIYSLTSAAYAEAASAGGDARRAAAKEWDRDYPYDGENQEPEHRLVLGGTLSVEGLLDVPLHPDEQGEGWDASEGSRFGRLARRLWDGPLRHEELTRA
jgi:exodeoxyribonuclease V gamma subunit